MAKNVATTLDPRDLITSENNQIRTTSLKVAEAFGKRHDDVLRKLKALDCSDEFNARNFAEIPVDVDLGHGRVRLSIAYEMTKDGFMFLVMGFTGKKAAGIKEAYINAFNAMAEQLHQAQLAQQQPHALADHSADQAALKQLVFEGQPVLTLAMINKLHQLPPNSAQRVYQREKAGFPLEDVIKVEDKASLELLRKMGVRVGSSILLLTASGYRRLAILLYSAGFGDVDSGPLLKDYFGLEADYSLDELQTLREAYELLMQWNHVQSSDLSSHHRDWLQRRWERQTEHFACTRRLLRSNFRDPMLERMSAADDLVQNLIEVKATMQGESRLLALTEWSSRIDRHAKTFADVTLPAS